MGLILFETGYTDSDGQLYFGYDKQNLICCGQRHVKRRWWASSGLPHTQRDRPGQAVILDQYLQDVRVSFTSQDKTSAPSVLLLEVFSSHPDWTNIIEPTSGQMTPCYWGERHELRLQISQNSTVTGTQSFRLVRRCLAALTLDGSSWLEAHHKPQPSFPQGENQNLWRRCEGQWPDSSGQSVGGASPPDITIGWLW